MIDEDDDAFLADHGLPCFCNGLPFLGIKDSVDENVGVSGMSAQANMVTLLVLSSVVAAASIKSGVAIIVDSVTYVARNPVRVDDGKFTSIPISRGKS